MRASAKRAGFMGVVSDDIFSSTVDGFVGYDGGLFAYGRVGFIFAMEIVDRPG